MSLDDADEGAITMQPTEITEILNRPISQELLARDLTRLDYVADRRHPDLGETHRFRNDPAHRGRGADPATG